MPRLLKRRTTPSSSEDCTLPSEESSAVCTTSSSASSEDEGDYLRKFDQNIWDAIQPHSHEKEDFFTACKEWVWVEMKDNVSMEADCICGHPELRYECYIRNKHTNARLLVGSKCIGYFDHRLRNVMHILAHLQSFTTVIYQRSGNNTVYLKLNKNNRMLTHEKDVTSYFGKSPVVYRTNIDDEAMCLRVNVPPEKSREANLLRDLRRYTFTLKASAGNKGKGLLFDLVEAREVADNDAHESLSVVDSEDHVLSRFGHDHDVALSSDESGPIYKRLRKRR